MATGTEMTPSWTENSDLTSSTPDLVIPDMTSLIIRTVTLLTISILALVGNSLVVFVVLKRKKLRTSTNVFVCNLSLACFVIGSELSILVANVICNRNVLGTVGCQAWGLTAIASYCVVTETFALISLSRFALICHPQRFEKTFSLRNSLIYSTITWLIGFLFPIGAVTGWSEIAFNPKTKACSYSRVIGHSFHYFINSFFFGIPLTMSVVSYVLLYIAVKRSANRTAPLRDLHANSTARNCTASSSCDQRIKGSPKKDWKLTRMLIITFVMYMVSIGPYSLVNIIDGEATLPEGVHITVSWFLYSNAAVNPFIYGVMNKSFREAYSVVCGKTAKISSVSKTQIAS